MQVFFVLGAPRSGTSLVAGTLHKSGIRMGDKLTPPDLFNPQGYFENLLFTSFNITMLRRLVDIEHLTPYGSERLMLPIKHIDTLRGLMEQNARHARWGIKDPRIVLLWTAYDAATRGFRDRVRLIVTHRNPLHNALSIAEKNGRPGWREALRLVNWYESRMCEIADEFGDDQVLHVAFEDWWYRFDEQVAKLEWFCDCPIDYSHFDGTLWRSG